MKLYLIGPLLVSLGLTVSANAQSLIEPGCGIISNQRKAEVLGENAAFILVGGFSNSTCDSVKNALSAVEVVNMAIMPALLVLKAPGVREELAAELATMGLTLANPAVLGVTVLGAFGYVTIYFVLKTTAEKCADQRIQELIKKEVEERTQLKYSKPIVVTQ